VESVGGSVRTLVSAIAQFESIRSRVTHSEQSHLGTREVTHSEQGESVRSRVTHSEQTHLSTRKSQYGHKSHTLSKHTSAQGRVNTVTSHTL